MAAFYLFFAALAAALSGCGGPLYDVATAPASPPPPASSTETAGVSVGVATLDGEQSLDQFDANLPLAGVIVLDLQIVNNSATGVQLDQLSYELRDTTGATFKPLKPQKALDRVMKFYGNSLYTLESRRLTRERYDAVGWKNAGELSPQSSRRGFLFFENKRRTINLNGLSLSVAGPDLTITRPVN